MWGHIENLARHVTHATESIAFVIRSRQEGLMKSEFGRSAAGSVRALPFVACLGLAIALVSFFGAGYASVRNILLDSDRLRLAVLYRDFVSGADLSRWVFAPASYWFPDYLQYFLLRYLTGNVQVAAICYAVIQVLLLTLGLIALGRQVIVGFNAGHYALGISLSTLFVVAHPLWIVQTDSLFAAILHGGVAVAMPFTLAMAMRLAFRRPSRLWWIAGGAVLAMISLLMTASDLMYVVQVLLPLAIAFLVPFVFIPSSRYRIVAVVTLLACSSVAGFVIDRIVRIRADNVTMLLAPERAIASLSTVAAAIEFAAGNNPVHVFLLGALFVTSVIVLISQTRRLARHTDRSRLGVIVFAAFYLSLALTDTVFVVATGMARDNWVLRYFLPLLLLASGFGFLFIATPLHGNGRWSSFAATSITCLIAAAAFAQFVLSAPSFDRLMQVANYYPASVACLDAQLRAYGVTRGVATYWQARPISELSRADLQITQVNSDLSPLLWLNSRDSYHIEPQFVVIDTRAGMEVRFRIDEAAVRGRFGSPAAVVDCPESRTLVYGRWTDTDLRNLFKGTSGLWRVE